MVTDEDMAVSFFAKGDADHLARELTTILQSPDLQRSMAEHNFAAGVQMTMGNVVRSYLRWFDLKKCQSSIAHGVEPTGNRARSADFANPLTWRKADKLADSPESDRYSASPRLESEL
jgi:hypothetical protein